MLRVAFPTSHTCCGRREGINVPRPGGLAPDARGSPQALEVSGESRPVKCVDLLCVPHQVWVFFITVSVRSVGVAGSVALSHGQWEPALGLLGGRVD